MSTETSSTYTASKKSVWPMFFLGLFLIALFFFVVRFLILWNPVVDEAELARAEQRIKNLETLKKEDEEQLTTYAWVDKEKGIVRIPIKRAMELQIAVLNNQEVRPAYPINPVVQEEAPATEGEAPAASPAAEGEAAQPSAPAEENTEKPEQVEAPEASENATPNQEATP